MKHPEPFQGLMPEGRNFAARDERLLSKERWGGVADNAGKDFWRNYAPF